MRISLLLCVAFLAGGFAAETANTLMPPPEPVAAGAIVNVDLVAMNPSGLDVAFHAPAELSGRLGAGNLSWAVTMKAVAAAPVAVPPGGFTLRRYQFTVPVDAKGRMILEIDGADLGVLRTVLDVTPKTEAAPPARVTPLDRLAYSAPVASTLARTFAGRFMPNLPIYFVYGSASGPAAKFQFSFDYRLATIRWNTDGDDAISTLRLGYTQRSLWDINANSSPFYDTSYMPELVFNTDALVPKDNAGWFTWMGLRAAFLHESNGRDGTASRSLNTVYLRPRFIIGSVDAWFLVVLPEFQAYVGGVGDDPRIKDYRGYGKLRMYLGRNDGAALMLSTWTGRDFNHPTFQLDLTQPLRWSRLNLESYFLLQYFDGYGESLRDYDRKSHAVRAGISLVR